ncbi:hypothetical protein [Rhodospirillum sp. A1_3_36]|uniref:hypothetical protein n=1 Tax=Rhodospirillum sp. A1_3_36 TaxID=3391666 RepID=UPI0039A76FC4
MAKLAEIYRVELGQEATNIDQCGENWIAELSNGWSIWWVEEPEGFNLQKLNPHLACQNGEAAYTVSIAEFCMHASFAKYTATSKRWSVVHHGDEYAEHIKTTGKPPKIFDTLCDELLEKQRNQTVAPVAEKPASTELQAIANKLGGTMAPFGGAKADFVFDLPVRLGEHFFGFRYDREPVPGAVVRCAEVLGPQTAPTPKAPLWRRIVGL